VSATASGSQTAPTTPPAEPPAEVPREVCPLCGGALRRDQDWCLRCGAAARTRLAAPPKWKLLVVSLVSLAVLALAVLVVALVTLAG
jgi:predicted amidophosphoribosyltransferase